MFVELFICARHSAQHGVYILSFNAHINTTNWYIIIPIFIEVR